MTLHHGEDAPHDPDIRALRKQLSDLEKRVRKVEERDQQKREDRQ
jgi:hypothetical protein